MSILGLHHVRFAVGDPSSFMKFLIQRFGFTHYAHRLSEDSNKTGVLRHGRVLFVIDQRKGTDDLSNLDEDVKDSFCKNNASYPVDTVCDACFQCSNIDEILQRVKLSGKGYIKVQSKVSNAKGTVFYAILQSPFGNVQHTLINLSQYHGQFLPSFRLQDSSNFMPKNHLTVVDHLAYMIPIGQIDDAVNWYNYIFGFERLFINRDDLISEGFQVESGLMGMKLKAIHGNKLCAQDSSDTRQAVHSKVVPVKFVFGEPLASSESDQVSTFLKEHCGGGIQHIGLGTNNIMEAVNHFKDMGAYFVAPPMKYYDTITSSTLIEDFNISLQELVQSGVLIESSDDIGSNEISLPMRKEPWYIMQVFTRNLFKEKTFFLELIQRHRTEGGFGARNIKALWDGVQAAIS